MRRALRGHRNKLFVPFARKFVLSTSFLHRVSPVWNFYLTHVSMLILMILLKVRFMMLILPDISKVAFGERFI